MENGNPTGMFEEAERWRALADNSLDTVIVVDREGRIAFANRSLAGGPRERYPGTLLYEYALPVEHETIGAVLRQVFEEGATVRTVLSGYGPHGSTAWYEHRIAPIRRDGVVAQALIVSTDISQSRDAAEALRRALADHDDLVRNAIVGIARTTPDGRFLSANQATARIFGYADPESLIREVRDVARQVWINPEARQEFRRLLAEFGELEGYEIHMRRRDGREIWIAGTFRVVYGGDGDIRYYEGILVDITQRKAAEAALRESEVRHRLMFDDNPVAMVVVEQESLAILAANAAATRLYGFSRDEFLALSALDIRPETEIPRFRAALRARSSAFKPVGDWKHRRKDGSLLDAEVVRHAIMFEGRAAWLVAVTDVTERKRVTAAVDRSRLQLEALSHRLLEAEEAERRRIARELHDETGQTLTSLLVGLKTLEDAKSLPDMRKGARRLREVCSGLVHDISRLARGLHPTVLDDLGLLAALKKLALDHSESRGVEVTVDSDGLASAKLPVNVQTALFRIAQEACGNSVRAGQPRHVAIAVKLQPDAVDLEVRDDGIGFDVERVSEQAARSGRLGLVGMRERAALLGGTLVIRSTPGSGASVRARIPLPSASLPGG